jgi:flagellar basal-body rod modification protein FlgD
MSTVAAVTNATPSQSTLDELNAQTQAQGGSSTLGVNDFLQLLTVQLQNQDPLKPMDDTQFISQMASFTTLQQTQTLTSDFQAFSAPSQLASANSFIGNKVTVLDPTLGSVTGQVTGVSVSNGTPELVVNGTSYALSAVQSVSWPSASTSNSTTQPTTQTASQTTSTGAAISSAPATPTTP